jgi:hypothetical protein
MEFSGCKNLAKARVVAGICQPPAKAGGNPMLLICQPPAKAGGNAMLLICQPPAKAGGNPMLLISI